MTIAVNDRRSDDRRIDGCYNDANMVMVVAFNDFRGQ